MVVLTTKRHTGLQVNEGSHTYKSHTLDHHIQNGGLLENALGNFGEVAVELTTEDLHHVAVQVSVERIVLHHDQQVLHQLL